MYENWSTVCPRCKEDGELFVIAVTLVATGERIEMFSPLYPDGFEVPVDNDDASTEDELVECNACGARFSLGDLSLC